MAEVSGLTFCMDESMGRPMAGVLRALRAPGAPHIHDLRELGLSGVTDEVMMGRLRQDGIDVVVTCDSRILAASVRRDLWRALGLTLMVLDGRWGNLRLFEQGRRLIWWWPLLVSHATSGPRGAAWRVPPEMRDTGLRPMFPDG